MSDFSKDGQLTFDFDDFSEHDSVSSREKTRGKKIRDDMTPGLFDPVVSEEEEMEAFLKKIHSRESSGDENTVSQSSDTAFVSASSEVRSDPSDEELPAQKEVKPRILTRKQLQRAATAFLASRKPSGLAQDVPACGARCKAGAAAFWLESGKVVRTAVAEIRTASDAALQLSGHEDQFQQLKLARMEREMLEQEIRRTEPGLRDSAMLFSEFEHWDYEATGNPSYRECLRRIRHLEHSIFHGSRLERFQNSAAASELYLVVPEHAVSAETLADGWGLVYIRPDLSFELVRPAEVLEKVPEKNLVRLALNIASANAPDVLFANGIRPAADGKTFRCGPLPRQRHRKS